jgi:extradiol dioxygenase family protein
MSERPLTPFHLAIPVRDLAQARAFYGGLLGCPEGRSAERWVDFNLYGHQLVCHLVESPEMTPSRKGHNPVDGDSVPVPHFGVVLAMADWYALVERLRDSRIQFLLEPKMRFAGETGEQATLFIRDPSGNALEFKAFRDIDAQLFAR